MDHGKAMACAELSIALEDVAGGADLLLGKHVQRMAGAVAAWYPRGFGDFRHRHLLHIPSRIDARPKEASLTGSRRSGCQTSDRAPRSPQHVGMVVVPAGQMRPAAQRRNQPYG